MDDLISRQAAIKQILLCENHDMEHDFEFNEGLIVAMNALEELPTAEPSTTLMKVEVGVDKESLRKAMEEAELTLVAEPRKGKWEVCNILDYAQRPSGRKILRCPFCGYLTDEFRSMVDYYHKLTHFCPNCGARMGESDG